MKLVGKANKTNVLGTSIAWSEMGSGPPLILIHGFQDTQRVWHKVAPLLADDFRVIMIDLPGGGLSGRPDASYTIDWYSLMLAAWMDTEGVMQAHICGHSFGGGIAQWMLLKCRNRIDRLALVAPGGLGREVGAWLKPATFPVIGHRLTPFVVRYLIPSIMRFNTGLFGKRDLDEIKYAAIQKRIPGTDRAFRRSIEGVINLFGQSMQTRHRVCEVDTLPPIALFWGEKDSVLPIKHGRATMDQSTGVTLTTYYKCGHYPHLDASGAFAQDLKEFLHDPCRPPACLFSKSGKNESAGIHFRSAKRENYRDAADPIRDTPHLGAVNLS